MKSPQQIAEIGFWLNAIDHKKIGEHAANNPKRALEFFGPAVALRLDPFEMRQACMRKLNS